MPTRHKLRRPYLWIAALLIGFSASGQPSVNIHAHATLETTGKYDTGSRVLFRHVLGGLHIEAYATGLPQKTCRLLIYDGSCDDKKVIPEKAQLLGTMDHLDDGSSYYEHIDPKLQARHLIGKNLIIAIKNRIIACGKIEAPIHEQ